MTMTTNYRIRIRGHLDKRWAEWFAPFVIYNDAGGEATLTGPIHDQAELHALLTKMRNMNLPLLALTVVYEQE